MLTSTGSDVIFARYANRRNIIYEVNITAAGNITCHFAL